MIRDTIFISHATPEDNEFTIWLASRLELMGYKVWIDKNELLGGEAFWGDIEKAITEKAVKFLLVYSWNICYDKEKGKIKNGIQKEIDFAKSIQADNPSLKDFFTILHVDDSPFDLFPGAGDLNQIPFNSNWAEGLTQLLKKLYKDSVPKEINHISGKSADWYLNQYIIKNPIVEKKELYYTNRWSIQNLPEQFYILRFKNEKQATTIHSINKNVVTVLGSNFIICFKADLDYVIHSNEGSFEVPPYEKFEIKISDIILGTDRASFPTLKDAENAFKRLLKRSLHLYIKKKQLKWYELASKDLAYYHSPTSLPSSKVTFQFPYSHRKKTKSLYGKYLTIGKWHFAVSFKPVISPSVGFQIKTHLIFTNNGFDAFENKDEQHSYRRKKGRRMFNEEWRDLVLGFMVSLRDSEEKFILDTSAEMPIVMKDNLEMFWSDFGYSDPKDFDRQALLTIVERDDEILQS